MSRTIVMVHGANCGGWCFDVFHKVFEARGCTCHTPDLIGHGADKENRAALAETGMADYRAQLTALVKALPEKPVVLGHSMGAVIAQQLAADGLAHRLVLVSPGPHAGIVPRSDPEKQLCQDLMAIGPFWTRALDPNFELACAYTLNGLPKEAQRAVFDKFGPESGRALFELFFWMFDRTRATFVEARAVSCPVLCLTGADDRIVSLATARASAEAFSGSTFRALEGHAHMLLLEDGAEAIAGRIADWLD